MLANYFFFANFFRVVFETMTVRAVFRDYLDSVVFCDYLDSARNVYERLNFTINVLNFNTYVEKPLNLSFAHSLFINLVNKEPTHIQGCSWPDYRFPRTAQLPHIGVVDKHTVLHLSFAPRIALVQKQPEKPMKVTSNVLQETPHFKICKSDYS